MSRAHWYLEEPDPIDTDAHADELLTRFEDDADAARKERP